MCSPNKKIINSKKFYLLLKFINLLLKNGKKFTVLKNTNLFFKEIKTQHQNPLAFFQRAVENIMPLFEIVTRRYGRQVVQIPKPILNKNKRYALGLKALINTARKRKENKFYRALFLEFNDAFMNKGNSKSNQQALHKIAVTNRNSVHYRW